MSHPLIPQPGSPLDPRDIVGRRSVLATALAELAAGNNLHLSDPRRMGKTVLLDLLVAESGPGIVAAKIDYEGVQSSEDFLVRTLTALRPHLGRWERGKQHLTTWFDGIEISGGPITVKAGLTGASRSDLLHKALRTVEASLNGDLILAMDEVPIAISNIAANQGPQAASEILQTLRELRKRPAGVGAPRIGWIVCGSIGFHHVLRRIGATEGAVNDLVNLPLGPFDDAEARELTERLLLGTRHHSTPEAVAAIVESSGRIPFLIHKLVQLLRDHGPDRIDPAAVSRAFDFFVRDRDESRAVTHLVTRLDLYGERQRDAGLLLDMVAVGAPHSFETLVAAVDLPRAEIAVLVDGLLDDHYLREADDGFVWRYDVLRRIWAHRRRLA